MNMRAVTRRIRAIETSDGAGVRLHRSLGQHPDARHDPFLLLDEFASDDPDDYLAGFPAHPHRGFETVTYMLEGHMLHEDHLGNRGDLEPGGAQWMTAGRGIIHSEMPKQQAGRMHGFQLWVNLPAREKMQPGAYRDVPAAEVTEATLARGGGIRLVAGALEVDGRTLTGPIAGVSTEPVFADIALPAGGALTVPLAPDHHALVYVFDGHARLGPAGSEATIGMREAALLGPGDAAAIRADEGPVRLLLLAARPLREPVVQYGPFVMNSREEIEQALGDYQSGRLTR